MKKFWQENKGRLVISAAWLLVCLVAFFFSEEDQRFKVVFMAFGFVAILWAISSNRQYHLPSWQAIRRTVFGLLPRSRRPQEEDIYGA